jgi:hypothetical protein
MANALEPHFHMSRIRKVRKLSVDFPDDFYALVIAAKSTQQLADYCRTCWERSRAAVRDINSDTDLRLADFGSAWRLLIAHGTV